MASKQSKQWTTAQLELIAQLKKEKEGFVQGLSEWIKKHLDQNYKTVLKS
ncbi:hypothetical protein IM774_04700 [Erysipelotrichaceae bacterium RD49]|nr:hypothetical protein [Erysipelotrichaceae bacterium RD49]